MIILIDNYDSFTHNLYQYLREITAEPVRVIRNDEATVAEIMGGGGFADCYWPWAGASRGCGDLSGADQEVRRQCAGTRGLPGAPSAGASVWRAHCAGTANCAWEGGGDHS